MSMHSLSLTLRQPFIDRLGLPCVFSVLVSLADLIKSLIPSSFIYFFISAVFFSPCFLFLFQKYLHVPFIEIWRQRAVAGCVVYCWGCWWYGAAALVLCGRWYYGGRCRRLVPWTGRWRWLRSCIVGFVDLRVMRNVFWESWCTVGVFVFVFVFDQTQNIRTSSKQIKSPNLTVGGHVQNSKKHKKETKKAYPKHNYSH